MKKPSQRMVGIGGVTIIMVFVVICLTIFAMLTLLTAHNAMENSKKSAAAISSYYEADSKAIDKLGQIKKIAEDTAFDKLESCLVDNGFSVGNDGSSLIVSYECEMENKLSLSVEVNISADKKIVISKWQTVNSDGFVFEDELPVWDGEI